MAKEKEKSRFDVAIDHFKEGSSVKGKKERRDTQETARNAMYDATVKYLAKVRGKNEDGSPKSFDIEGPDEAHDMVLEMARAVVDHKYKGMDEKGRDHIKKNEHLLMEIVDHALGQSGAGYNLIKHFADHGDNVTNSRQYLTLRDRTADHVANGKYEHAKDYLTAAEHHREKIEKIVNDELAAQGFKEKTLRKGLSQSSVVQHLGTAYEKGFNPDYVEGKDAFAAHFKKKDKK